MLATATKGRPKVISNSGIVGTTSPGTTLTSNGTTLLDGAVTELISAANNTQDSWGISINIGGTGSSATAAEGCVDILIGGATDDVLIPALICGYGGFMPGYTYMFPLHIPQGLRIAATFASVLVSQNARVLVNLYGGSPAPWRTGRKVTTYGTQINNARGQAVVPTASGGAASVTQMTASTTYDHFAFIPGFQPATDSTITPAGYVNIGIGVGASTEERIGTWWFAKNAGEECGGPMGPLPAFQEVPAGTRLTMLASNSGANDAAYDGLIYAVS